MIRMELPKISFSDLSKPKQPKYANKGFLRASYAQSLVTAPASVASMAILNQMKKVSNLSHEDAVQLRKAAQFSLKSSGLYNKGVRAYTIHENPVLPQIKDSIKNIVRNVISKKDITDETLEQVAKQAQSIMEFGKKDYKALNALKTEVMASREFKSYTKNPLFKDVTEYIANWAAIRLGHIFKEGMNTCFLPNANKIITPDKSLQTSIFHEMGHALNYNGGGVLKALQKARPVAMILPGIILADALLNKRKTTDEKLENNSVKNRVQNFRDGIKKHAGLLIGLSWLPTVAEEGIASLRGQGLAKQQLQIRNISKALYKRIKLTNLCGFSTYVLCAVAMAAGAKFAIGVKDNIQAKYEAKKLAKYEAKQAKKQAKELAKAQKTQKA